jgi:hypothetical protein
LLEKVYDSLPDKNGVVMIYGWLLNDKNTNPIPSSIFGLYNLIYISRSYWFTEISKMLSDIKFIDIEENLSKARRN